MNTTPTNHARPAADPRARQCGAALTLILAMIGIAVVVALIAGGATYWLTAASAGTGDAAKTAQPQAKGPPARPELVDLDTFTVNLQGANHQVLYIGLTLKVGDNPTAKRIQANRAELRSRILTELSDQKAKKLQTAEGKKALAADLLDTASKPFADNAPPLDVRAVFFSHFVMH